MILKWLFKSQPPATLKAIFITSAAGDKMQTVQSIDAIAQRGLQGDRYSASKGFWQATDACQVTLISEDDLSKAKKGQAEKIQGQLGAGSHRRNLVVTGIKTKVLQGRTFRIGDAVFCYHKPRPPCGYLDRIEGRGLSRALGKHSGVCLQVISSGTIMVGDHLHMVEHDNA